MKITSLAFENEQYIPSEYACDGANGNPPLEFSDVPNGTKSLALIIDDPEAEIGTWTHWIVWGITPKRTKVEMGVTPEEATEGKTSFGTTRYGGPCPPKGSHRYFFKLYALDEELNLPPGSQRETLEEVMAGHILDKAELIGLYRR